MTRRTPGIRTAAGFIGVGLSGLLVAAGCTREERRTSAMSAAQLAVASVTTTAAGSTTSTPPSRRSNGIKVDGRGGFDASEAQRNALIRAEYIAKHHNDVIKPFQPRTQPTTSPTR